MIKVNQNNNHKCIYYNNRTPKYIKQQLKIRERIPLSATDGTTRPKKKKKNLLETPTLKATN